MLVCSRISTYVISDSLEVRAKLGQLRSSAENELFEGLERDRTGTCIFVPEHAGGLVLKAA